ncbi:hypothetical protein ACFPL7_22790 [Dongia soli]|uniref:Uncharacterized protein n=1 Tax=Dongia soli TaxID=600628 RepID=A0ABU5E8R4_9PROT|nr:hypothetical protein [Dongia soli]MDY0882420.1 hypothetical protein [Dongia soli]
MADLIKPVATYRDLSVTAAAEAQSRRNRQRALLQEDGPARLATPVEQPAAREQEKSSYQAIQDAVGKAQERAAEQEPQFLENQDSSHQASKTALAQRSTKQIEARDEEEIGDESDGSLEDLGLADDESLSAPYAAQVLAQEYLGEGLHIPPLQPADEAYRRAGAEPPLVTEDASPSVMSLAI